jgi:hypothetical protein
MNGFGNLDRLINLQKAGKGSQMNVFQSNISSLNMSSPIVTEINLLDKLPAVKEINEATVE